MAEKFWVLCGRPENWEIALKDGIWGLIPKFGGKWKYVQIGDWLFFYVTQPISGVIGMGKIEAKFKQNQPLWPEEILQKQVLYPFRFEFKAEYVLPQEGWKAKRIKTRLPMGSYSGMNLLDDQDIIEGIQKAIKQNWGTQFEPSEKAKDITPKLLTKNLSTETIDLSHDKIKDMVFEIGKIHRYITEKEYVINSDRLDVVWRRVEKSVPTYAFEIHIGGDLYHALAKLKHAYDIWNSNIYLVVEDTYYDKIQDLLAGTFHEIRNVLNIIGLQQIKDLYYLQVEDVKLRRQMRLP